MLILTRNKGERIVIEYPNGDRVIVEFQKVKSSKTVLGVDAPDDIKIYRDELLAQKLD